MMKVKNFSKLFGNGLLVLLVAVNAVGAFMAPTFTQKFSFAIVGIAFTVASVIFIQHALRQG